MINDLPLIYDLALSDYKAKYASSYIGVLWAFVQPVVSVLIYIIIFGYGFKATPVQDFPFVLWLVSGIIPWFYFSEALTAATGSLREYSYLVKKIIFNIKILPAVKITAALMIHVFFIGITLAVFLIYGYAPSAYFIQLIYYMVCTTMLVLGLSYFTAALGAFSSDFSQAVNIVLQFGMWMTPIMWKSDIFGPEIERIVKINPMYYIVEGYRDCFFQQVGFWEKPGLTVWFWAVTVLLFWGGMFTFKKLEKHFADVL